MKVWVIVAAAAVVAALLYFGVISTATPAHLQCKWKQEKATSNLKEIAKRIAANVAKGKPAASFDDLAWNPKDHDYDYMIDVGFNGHFDVEARASNNNGDDWHIDENYTLRKVRDGCYTGG